MKPGSVKEFVKNNVNRINRRATAIEDFFNIIENDINLKNQYDILVRSSNSKAINSQIGRQICAILGMQFNKREHPSRTTLIGSFSNLKG
jgi:hypothetical protein